MNYLALVLMNALRSDGRYLITSIGIFEPKSPKIVCIDCNIISLNSRISISSLNNFDSNSLQISENK